MTEKYIDKKVEFEEALVKFVDNLQSYVSTDDGQWTIKGFIDVYKKIYTISSDTKIISKILEIHIFPELLKLSEDLGYDLVLTKHQNYYPDISFVNKADNNIKFAVDFKTTYRNPKKPHLCNGFTLGSRGAYFKHRTSTKNIQFPYGSYSGHFCLGIIYDRAGGDLGIDETKVYDLDSFSSIPSVIGNFQFFAVEKWKIASDKSGSGNTANIGSIKQIEDIKNGRGVFSKLGEKYFDEYWINYGQIEIPNNEGDPKKITSLIDFLTYRSEDEEIIDLIVPMNNSMPSKVK